LALENEAGLFLQMYLQSPVSFLTESPGASFKQFLVYISEELGIFMWFLFLKNPTLLVFKGLVVNTSKISKRFMNQHIRHELYTFYAPRFSSFFFFLGGVRDSCCAVFLNILMILFIFNPY
jgi:hypothetical protein